MEDYEKRDKRIAIIGITICLITIIAIAIYEPSVMSACDPFGNCD